MRARALVFVCLSVVCEYTDARARTHTHTHTHIHTQVVATRDIAEGDEIYVDYGRFPLCFWLCCPSSVKLLLDWGARVVVGAHVPAHFAQPPHYLRSPALSSLVGV